MAPSSRGRGSIAKAAALDLASKVTDPSSSTASSSVAQTQIVQESTPQALPEVAYGKTLNVPDHFLGAGHTGKGWTIDEAVMEGGKPTIKLHRRVKETGQIEEHTIDLETYQAAKAYKDAQGGMSKAGRPPLLKRSELGRGLDPQGDIIPDRFDGASRTYRVLLPGSRQPQWVSEGLIKEYKDGKPGALQRLRSAVGLDKPQDETPAQVITGAVAGAVLGKNLATRLGLRERQEQSVDRPSAPTSAATQTRDANRAAILPEDRAKQEDDQRQGTLRQRRDQLDEEEEDTQASAPNRRTVTYQTTDQVGESSQITSQGETDQASTRIETTRRAGRDSASGEKGTRLQINEDDSSSDANTKQASAAASTLINQPKSLSPLQPSATGESGSSVPQSEEAGTDPVQTTLERAAKRRQRVGTSTSTPSLGSPAGYTRTEYGASPSQEALGQFAASVGASLPSVEEVNIRQMRQLMQAQARERNISLTSRTTSRGTSASASGAGVSLSLSSTPSVANSAAAMAQDASGLAQGLANAVGGAAGQVVGKAVAGRAALRGARMAAQVVMSVAGQERESALQQVKNVRQRLEAQVAEATVQVTRPSAPSSGTIVPPTSSSIETVDTTSFQEPSSLSRTGQAVLAQQDLSLLQKSLGTVKQTEDALTALPPHATVPAGFQAQISGLENLLQTLPQTPPFDEENTEIETAEGTISSGLLVIPPPSSPIASDHLQSNPAASSGVRVGTPPVPRRRSPAGSTSDKGVGTFTPRPTLSPSLNSAVHLNADQARDRASDQGLSDTRTNMLNDDTSVSTGGGPQTQPLSSSYTNTLPDPEEAEDVFRTVGEEAVDARRASEQARATQESLSGNQETASSGTPDADTGGQISEQGSGQGLSPQEQLAFAISMQAAQSIQAAHQTEASAEKTDEAGLVQVNQIDPEPGFVQRMTKFKLIGDLLEGCLDGIGFLEFFVESNIALINDRYFKLSMVPSLKKPGTSERHERYLRYGIILIDILLFFLILLVVSVITGIIVVLLG